MGVHVLVCCSAATIILVSALSATVDGSLILRPKVRYYGNDKELRETPSYSLFGKSVQGPKNYSPLLRYQQTAPPTIKVDSPPSAPVASLLRKLIQSRSGGTPVRTEVSKTTDNEVSLFLNWLLGDRPASVAVTSAQPSDDEVTDTTSTRSLLAELIEKMLNFTRKSQQTPAPDAEDDDGEHPSSAETTDSRIRDLLAKLLRRQLSGVDVRLTTDYEQTRSNTTGSTESRLIKLIREALRHRQSVENDDDENASPDISPRRRMFDLMELIVDLIGVDEIPENSGTPVKIPKPMPLDAAIHAIDRWLERTRTPPNSPGRLVAIFRELLRKIKESRSSTTSKTFPSSPVKQISDINRSDAPASASPTSPLTLLSKLIAKNSPRGSSSVTTYSTPSSLAKKLKEIKFFRSTGSSSVTPSLSKWFKALEKTEVPQSPPSTTSPRRLVQWLGKDRSGTGKLPPTATDPLRSTLREVLADLKRLGAPSAQERN